MTGHTPKWGLPYPEPADYVSDSQAVMQQLAEKIDTALSAVTASDAYTVPGTLIANMTTSGTFTPPAGVTLVSVVVVSGGGDGFGYVSGDAGSGGGGGGGVRVYRGVPVSGPVSVLVGGQATASAFGALTAPAGDSGRNLWPGRGWNWNGTSMGGAGRFQPGTDGPQVNGTYYAGGGGGGGYPPGSVVSGQGTRGRGGHGGVSPGGPGGGASGCVMVYTEQATMRRNVTVPNPDPLIVAALDPDGTMTGAYAVDVATRELPDIGVRVVDYPLQPVDTGRTVTAPADPADPDGPTVEVPVLAWPETGWTYTDGWKEPTP